MKTDIEIETKILSLETYPERRKLLYEWTKTGVITFKQFEANFKHCTRR